MITMIDLVYFNRFTEPLALEYMIEAETFTGKKISRVFFKQRGQSDAANIIKKSINLVQTSDQRFKCKDHQVYIVVSISAVN